MNFKNDTKELTKPPIWQKEWYPGEYKYDKPSKYLFVWSRLLQRIVSQAGSKMIGQGFHTHECAIYKSEGGCYINGLGELVLGRSSCSFDSCGGGKETEKNLEKMAGLIHHIIINWDPNDPIDSMLNLASGYASLNGDPKNVFTVSDLREAVEKSSCGHVFGGDALTNFFNWNPFSDAPIDREYEKWCRVTFNKETPEEVDQNYVDIEVGNKYKDLINEKIRKAGSQQYNSAMCCRPRRGKDGLGFWINTGRSTVIDGWKTETQIKSFLAGDGLLHDKARY